MMILLTVAGSRIVIPLGCMATVPVLPGGRRREPGRVHHGFDAYHSRVRTQSIFAFLDLGRLFLLDPRTGAPALFHLCVLLVVLLRWVVHCLSAVTPTDERVPNHQIGSMDLGRPNEIRVSFE